MADTDHVHAAAPVEGDGVNYRGIVWFVVILTATTLFCQALVWGMFEFMEYRAENADRGRAPLAAPVTRPAIEAGRVVSGTDASPAPRLLVSEPTVLREFRRAEDTTLHTYGWVDRATGLVHMPIDRAKDLVLERGLPARTGVPARTQAAPITRQPATPAPAAPAGTAHGPVGH